ncbi:MAG: hypothetical protein ABI946_09575 [Chthoniobacterales bacterium]
MRTAVSLLSIFALLSFTTARAETDDAQGQTWPSPDGKIVIAQPVFRGPILFVDAATQETLFTDAAGAKTLAVAWSADSSWVAFSEYFNPHRGGSAFEVYHVVGKVPKRIAMPEGPLSDGEDWSFAPQRWLPGEKLVLEGERERWINETKDGHHDYRWDLYRFTIQCRRDATAKVLEKRYLSSRDE